ncbi:MAG: DciA family protein [Brevinematia bacterium]
MVKNIFHKIISKISKPSVSIMFSILSSWKEVGGDFFFKHCMPYKFFVKKSELYLACDDPNIATEVYFNQGILKERIKNKLRLNISTIKTVYDLNRFNRIKSIFEEPRTQNFEIKLNKSDINKINSKVKVVEDPELKESLRIFFETMSVVSKIRSKTRKQK